jgi:hypothetical protein
MQAGRLDQPELHIAVFGFLTAFVWEMWQMPFYDMHSATYFEMAQLCTLASIGDGVLMLVAYSVVSWSAGSRFWMKRARRWHLLAYVAVGLLATIAFEELATRSPWGWRYGELMPLVPGTHIALVPVAMWIVIPLLTLWIARRQPMADPTRR